MSCRVLVVEDEILVAMEIENIVEDMGHRPIGVAQDSKRARELAKDAELAFVDLNLVDGPTGIELGPRPGAAWRDRSLHDSQPRPAWEMAFRAR